MTDRIRTSYADLARRLAGAGLLDETEASRLERLIHSGSPEAVGYAVHDAIRLLVRRGQLLLRSGQLDRPGRRFSAADPRRGHAFTLPDLIDADHPTVRLPLDSSLGPPPSFDDAEIIHLFLDQSRRILSSVERSADLKGVVTGTLDVVRQILATPSAVCFTRSLPIPSGIGRGLGQLMRRDSEGSEEKPAFEAATWQPWVEEARRRPAEALYLPDLSLLPPEERILPSGSALLWPLQETDPTWDAVLVALSPDAYWFNRERAARIRLFTPHFRRQFTYAVQLQTAISHDYLTSVYNRAFFEDLLLRAVAGAARREQSFALLIIDIDDFKAFNSQYGYDAGDQVLRSVAATLGGALRSTDVLARYGGEEFAAILAAPVSPTEAGQVSERLRSAVEALTVAIPTLSGSDGHAEVQVTVSIGGAIFPGDGTTRDALWGKANRMQLRAKQQGKNRVCLPWDDEDGARRLRVVPGSGSTR